MAAQPGRTPPDPLAVASTRGAIAVSACAGLTPAQIIQKVVSDAASYSTAHSEYGFFGDPADPEPGKYFGYLIRAAGY